jgi:putative transposase
MPYWRLLYHIIWGTKNREPLICDLWEQDLYGYLWGKTTSLEILPHAINGMSDHIHLAISIPPKLSIAKVVGRLKGSSSRYINRELYLNAKFAWQSSYGVISVSESHKVKLINYIKNQKQHHMGGTIDSKFEITSSPPGAEPPGS